ncbi:hypothetical protein GCM10025877_22140 [Agromyces mangrovi Wang et al. 2018]|nr:hypothetical protein GCM10025877_22140 [Agromyces mangrovi]
MRGPDSQESADSGLSCAFSRETEEDSNEQEWPFGVARGWHAPTFVERAGWLGIRKSGSSCHRARAISCHFILQWSGETPDQKVFSALLGMQWHGMARLST